MAQKHLLTVLHCVFAAVVTTIGLVGAESLARDQPVSAFFVYWGAIIVPVFITTRIAWAAGQAAGRKEAREDPAEIAASNR